VIVLVPLSRFRVRWEMATGRPYSKLERLVLRAVREGAANLDDLTTIFHIHRRLLIEALVTLTQAGWLAVSGTEGRAFVMTAEGEAASGVERPTSLVVTPRTTYVVMERLAGLVLPNAEVRFVNRRDLGSYWDAALRLLPKIVSNRLDEGQVQHLLPRRQGERVQWIGPIDLDTSNANWLPVDVDLEADSVVGLPDPWKRPLARRVLAETRAQKDRIDGGVTTEEWKLPRTRRRDRREDTPDVPSRRWRTRVAPTDIIVGQAAHRDALKQALEATPLASSALLAAPSISETGVAAELDVLEAAIFRGVKVDVLWAADRDSGRAALRRLALSLDRRGARGILRFNASSARTNIRALMWEERPGVASAIVGGWHWLDATEEPSERAVAVSIRVRHPRVVAAVIRAAAGAWGAAPTEGLSVTPDRWRIIARELEAREVDDDDAGTQAEVVVDGDHDVLVEMAADTDKLSVLASEEVSREGADRVRAEGLVRGEILFGHARDAAAAAAVEDLATSRVAVTRAPIRGGVLIWRDNVVATGYSFLGPPASGIVRARDVGVRLLGDDALPGTVIRQLRDVAPSGL
jgi:hypothetical protein